MDTDGFKSFIVALGIRGYSTSKGLLSILLLQDQPWPLLLTLTLKDNVKQIQL